MKTYDVIRAHSGDKDYKVGDTRTAFPNEVAHLVGKCLVERVGKAAIPVKNKAAKKHLNKSAG